MRERLGANGVERHRVDPEPGVHGLDPALEEASEMRAVAGCARGRDAAPRRAAVHPAEQQREFPRAEPVPFQRSAKLFHQPGDRRLQSGKVDQGFREGQACEAGRRQRQGRRRVGAAAERAVEAFQNGLAPLPAVEAARKRRAGQGVHRADGHQAEAAQQAGVLGRDPECFDRQGCECGRSVSGRGDAAAFSSEAGERPGGARRVGKAGPHLEAEAGDARLDLRRHRRLAAEEMVGAGDVEQQAVRAVHRAAGREAVAPERQAFEPAPVLRRPGFGCGEAGQERAGVGKPHAGREPLGFRLPVDRRQHRAVAAGRGERERHRLSRRLAQGQGGGPPRAAQPVDRPARQPHRNHPSHGSTPQCR